MVRQVACEIFPCSMQYSPGGTIKGVGVGPGRWYLSRVFRLTVEAFAVHFSVLIKLKKKWQGIMCCFKISMSFIGARISSHAHKTGSWFLFIGFLSKTPNEQPPPPLLWESPWCTMPTLFPGPFLWCWLHKPSALSHWGACSQVMDMNNNSNKCFHPDNCCKIKGT